MTALLKLETKQLILIAATKEQLKLAITDTELFSSILNARLPDDDWLTTVTLTLRFSNLTRPMRRWVTLSRQVFESHELGAIV